MQSILAGVAEQHKWPLKGLIRPGLDFRIGRPSIPFQIAKHQGDDAILVAEDHSLKVTSRYRPLGTSITISHRLENTGTERSAPLDLIEPLHLMFEVPSERWRHIYANGGTTEAFYPPSAYRTHERTRSTRQSSQSRAHPPLTIESHPEGRSSNLHIPPCFPGIDRRRQRWAVLRHGMVRGLVYQGGAAQ